MTKTTKIINGIPIVVDSTPRSINTDSPNVPTGRNIGGGAGVYSGKLANNQFDFRTIHAGDGISIETDSKTITITNTLTLPPVETPIPDYIIGPIGPQGEPGVRGEQGANGQDGVRGDNGQDGMPGPRGLQGIMGPQGLPGVQGIAGPQGPQGVQGNQGIMGIAGQIGPKGDTGPIGPKGEPGNTISVIPYDLFMSGVIFNDNELSYLLVPREILISDIIAISILPVTVDSNFTISSNTVGDIANISFTPNSQTSIVSQIYKSTIAPYTLLTLKSNGIVDTNIKFTVSIIGTTNI